MSAESSPMELLAQPHPPFTPPPHTGTLTILHIISFSDSGSLKATKYWGPCIYIWLICLEGKWINTPHRGKHWFLLFLPATHSSRSQTLEGLFKLTRRPSKVLNLTLYFAPRTTERQGPFQTLPFVLGMEIPRHCQQQLMRTLIKCL